MSSHPALPPTLGAILAGGRARRLGGGDKMLRTVGGRTILARQAERLAPQVTRLVLNVNDDPRRLGDSGLVVVPDSLPEHPGPLAGLLAVLEWVARCEPEIAWVATVPGDAPFLPRNLVALLHAGRERAGAAIACAASEGRIHPVVGLWPVSATNALHRALTVENARKVEAFARRYPIATVAWPTEAVDPFFNVNTAEDLAQAERLATQHPGL